jgi:hypothetical protein
MKATKNVLEPYRKEQVKKLIIRILLSKETIAYAAIAGAKDQSKMLKEYQKVYEPKRASTGKV